MCSARLVDTKLLRTTSLKTEEAKVSQLFVKSAVKLAYTLDAWKEECELFTYRKNFGCVRDALITCKRANLKTKNISHDLWNF